MHSRPSNWLVRVLWRVFVYSVMGGLACGLTASSFGAVLGGICDDRFGAALGAQLGFWGGLVLGAAAFMPIGLKSDPEDFQTAFGRALPLAITGMAAGAAIAAITIPYLVPWATSEFPRRVWDPSENFAIFQGAFLPMALGLVIGASHGARRRWTEPDKFACDFAQFSLTTSAIAGLIISWYVGQQSISDNPFGDTSWTGLTRGPFVICNAAFTGGAVATAILIWPATWLSQHGISKARIPVFAGVGLLTGLALGLFLFWHLCAEPALSSSARLDPMPFRLKLMYLAWFPNQVHAELPIFTTNCMCVGAALSLLACRLWPERRQELKGQLQPSV